jgi:Flp pilus assembly protein TadG
MSGQAMVEFALILPLLLLLIVGSIWTSLYLQSSSRLQHAAQEGAVAGASAEEGTDRCERAIEATEAVLAADVDRECIVDGELVTVTLSGSIAVPPPLDAIHDGSMAASAVSLIRAMLPASSASP